MIWNCFLKKAGLPSYAGYDEGYTSYLEVLDAERSLYGVELAYTDTQGTLFQSLVTIYRSMGGGWIAEAEKLGAPEPVQKARFIP